MEEQTVARYGTLVETTLRKLGWPQTKLARLVELDQSTISNLVRGRRNTKRVTVDTLHRIRDVLARAALDVYQQELIRLGLSNDPLVGLTAEWFERSELDSPATAPRGSRRDLIKGALVVPPAMLLGGHARGRPAASQAAAHGDEDVLLRTTHAADAVVLRHVLNGAIREDESSGYLAQREGERLIQKLQHSKSAIDRQIVARSYFAVGFADQESDAEFKQRGIDHLQRAAALAKELGDEQTLALAKYGEASLRRALAEQDPSQYAEAERCLDEGVNAAPSHRIAVLACAEWAKLHVQQGNEEKFERVIRHASEQLRQAESEPEPDPNDVWGPHLADLSLMFFNVTRARGLAAFRPNEAEVYAEIDRLLREVQPIAHQDVLAAHYVSLLHSATHAGLASRDAEKHIRGLAAWQHARAIAERHGFNRQLKGSDTVWEMRIKDRLFAPVEARLTWDPHSAFFRGPDGRKVLLPLRRASEP